MIKKWYKDQKIKDMEVSLHPMGGHMIYSCSYITSRSAGMAKYYKGNLLRVGGIQIKKWGVFLRKRIRRLMVGL